MKSRTIAQLVAGLGVSLIIAGLVAVGITYGIAALIPYLIIGGLVLIAGALISQIEG